jgi:hypothetical protein
MAIASGASVGLSYVAEVTRGTTPGGPTMLELRSTSRNINATRRPLQSAERRSNRQIQDFRHGFKEVTGGIGFELAMADYDAMLEGAMGATLTAGVTTSTATLNSVNATSKFTRASGSFVTNAFNVGDWITTTGCGQSTTYFLVTAVSASELTVTPAPVDDTGGGDEVIQVKGRTLDIGSTLKTFTFERRFNDITQYQPFRGVAINSMSVSIQPEQIVTCTLDLLGMSYGDMTGSSLGTPTAASYTSPFSAFDGGLYIDGAEVAVVTGMDFNLANGRVLQPVVGNTISPDVFEGTANVSGTLSFLLQDATLVSLFEDETEFKIALKLDELGDATDFHALTFPRVKLNGANMDPPQEGPIIVSAPFQALYDATNGTTLRWQISNAS